MNTKILDQKGEERYCIVIHDLRGGEDDTRKPAFNTCVYDMEKSGDWNDWIAVVPTDTEEKAREAMENFYKEYYKEGEK